MQKAKSNVKKAVLCVGMLLLTLILCIGFSGCAVNVSGKTFVYEKYEVKYDDSVSEDAQKLYEATLVAAKKVWELNKFTFGEDGKVTGTALGSYTQDGSKLTVSMGDTVLREFTVSGKKLKENVSAPDGITVTVIYCIQE